MPNAIVRMWCDSRVAVVGLLLLVHALLHVDARPYTYHHQHRQRHLSPALVKSISKMCANVDHRSWHRERQTSDDLPMVQLRSKMHTVLAVYPNVINGTGDTLNKFSVIEVNSIEGLVTLRGKAAGKYICMNRKGRMFPRSSIYKGHSSRPLAQCIFMDHMDATNYKRYSPCAWPKRKVKKRTGEEKSADHWYYISLQRTGKPLLGRRPSSSSRVNRWREGSKFVDINITTANWTEMMGHRRHSHMVYTKSSTLPRRTTVTPPRYTMETPTTAIVLTGDKRFTSSNEWGSAYSYEVAPIRGIGSHGWMAATTRALSPNKARSKKRVRQQQQQHRKEQQQLRQPPSLFTPRPSSGRRLGDNLQSVLHFTTAAGVDDHR